MSPASQSSWLATWASSGSNGRAKSKLLPLAGSTIAAILLVLAGTGTAKAAGWVWPIAYAESTLEREYQTVDPWALRDAQEKLRADLAAGWPETSATVRHDREDIATARRAAEPRWAHCRGVGNADRNGTPAFARFWCSVRLDSALSGYQATKRLTLVVRGRSAFRALNGWH